MKLVDLQAKKKEYMNAIEKDGKALLKEAFIDFFNDNSEVEAIKWECFTPYFNDGDVCEYGIYDFQYKFKDNNKYNNNEDDQDYGDNEDGFLDKWNLKEDIRIKFRDWEKSVTDKDLYRIIFGDHVQVTATREGFEVEEYEHD